MAYYRIPAERHYKDARFLQSHNRLHNADHLFGVAAECALKCIMAANGMDVDRNTLKPTDSRYRCHANALWDIFRTFAEGRSLARYVPMLGSGNPFSDWHINQRYDDMQSLTEERLVSHAEAAKKAYSCLFMAISEGLVGC